MFAVRPLKERKTLWKRKYLWQLHRPITMSRSNASELTPLGMLLEVLQTCCWNIQTGDMNLAKHILTQFKRCGDTQVHLYKTRVDKSLIINKLHCRRHIHLLHNSAIESMLPNTLTVS